MISDGVPFINFYHHNADLMSSSPPSSSSSSHHHSDGYYSVVDVYDAAADIGKEFERVIDVYGSDVIATVMPKIVTVLEQLEYLAQRNERDRLELSDIKMTVRKLESTAMEKSDQKAKFEKEVEQIEEQWKKESEELLDTIQKLQDENRKLSSVISDETSPHHQRLGGDEDLIIMGKLKDVVAKQREQMKSRDKEITQKQMDSDALQMQVERLSKVNQDLRRKNKVVQQQLKVMIDDKVELQTNLQDDLHTIRKLRSRLDKLEKQTEDLATKTDEDKNGSEKPRFTLSELREVLQERNDLKGQVIELEEELAFFRSGTPVDDDDIDDFDLPVHGPLPEDPDDAPWKKSEKSGIKKFFRFLLGDSPSHSAQISLSSGVPKSPSTSNISPKHSK